MAKPIGQRRTPCRHCQRKPATRARQLCWRCYESPARHLYPVNARHCGTQEAPDFCGESREATPTETLPLTADRLAVLMERAHLGQRLHHPADARLDLS